MSITSAAATLLGGLGLFLAGMWLMTEGLKLAAGAALRDILRSWTDTRLRGLGTGFMITALVQSSSAVTVATIGFANAGLLSLDRAIWVIFGSNVGTTMTGWLAALIGFKVSIEAFALPLIGFGMLLRLTGPGTRRGALGQALAGFGLFFLGISILKDGFTALAADYQLPATQGADLGRLLMYLLTGVFLTTIMQSSSAALVITLGAAEGGVIPLVAAAAVVIGANLGTTSTAILSVWGATSTARRVAASHVIFNLATAVIAILIIAPILTAVEWVEAMLDLPPAPATTLALFHTTFNVLGVLFMWPFAGRLTNWLHGRFVTGRDLARRPMYLDDNVLEVPAVAAEALIKELNRLARESRRIAAEAIGAAGTDTAALKEDHESLAVLGMRIGKFVAAMGRTSLSPEIATVLPEVISVINRYSLITELAVDVAALPGGARDMPDPIATLTTSLNDDALHVLQSTRPVDKGAADVRLQKVEDSYDALKLALLQAGSSGSLEMEAVDARLNRAYLTKRIARRAHKAARGIAEIESALNVNAQPASG